MSQYDAIDRLREINGALVGHDGAHGSVALDGGAIITGTLALNELATTGMLKITDSGNVTWKCSLFSVMAVGIG